MKSKETITECASCGLKFDFPDDATFCCKCGNKLVPPIKKEPFKLEKPNLYRIPNAEIDFDSELINFPCWKESWIKSCETCHSEKNEQCKAFHNFILRDIENYRCDKWNNKDVVECPNCKYLVKKQRHCPVCHTSLKSQKGVC